MINQIKNNDERIIILGASRGLGYEFARYLITLETDLLLLSRRIDTAEFNSGSTKKPKLMNMDFTKFENLSILMNLIKDFSPSRIVYCAGGGPYGKFSSKEWKDHEWALNLNLIFPMKLLHELIKLKNNNNSKEDPIALTEFQQFIIVGSSIAESKPDPGAASYATAKHGLVGLISTLNAEGVPFELKLFSPGYMDTQMLPVNAAPRRTGVLIENPRVVAQQLWNFMK